MSEQQELKVYELAKELGIDSFALLDKLKQINIEVKSHMSSLGIDQAKQIRDALSKENKSGATVVKKRASATAGTGAVAGAAGAAASMPVKKPVAKKVAVTTAASPETVATKPPAAAKKVVSTSGSAAAAAATTAATDASKRKVIKRRTGSESAESTISGKNEAGISSDSVESNETLQTSGIAASEADVFAPGLTSEELSEQIRTEQIEKRKKMVEEFAPKLNAPGTKAILRTPTTNRVVERDELMDEFSSRRLKIVQAAPPEPIRSSREPQPTYRTPGGPTGERKRPAGAAGASAPGTGTGASARDSKQPPADMFQPFTSYVSKEEEVRGKKGLSTKTTNVEEIKIADFRKRELVFQPKRKKLPPGKMVKRTAITEMAAHKKKIRMDDKILISDLAQMLGEKNKTLLHKLEALGTPMESTQYIDFDTATVMAAEFGWEVENTAFDEKKALEVEEISSDKFTLRPPVITVMGHVDHGKTSLLDAIRNADVASGEAGGITQHIGAYSVEIGGKFLTFLDTPGHEAFANMRSRGANVTDIVVLVVAADDSIMPQTKEAIQHALTAGVPIIVAANKMDKPDASVEKLKKDLSANNVLVEDWGGEVPLVPVSALKKTGIKELLETIQIHAEVLDLKSDPDRSAEGAILEARMEKGRGIVADLLVRKGTLHLGDFLVVGTSYGRVKAMMNDRGKNIQTVAPGFPAEIFGLNEIPSAGDVFHVVKTEEAAKDIVQNRRMKLKEEKTSNSQQANKTMTLDELMNRLPVPGVKELNLIIKADVFGSSEAIRDSIEKIKSDKAKVRVLSNGVGVVTENDVLMAKTSNAVILGFNSKPDSKAREIAKREKVDIRHYSIIYQLLDDVRATLENLLDPIRKETLIGKAEVKQVFTVSKLGTVAGSVVQDGKVVRNAFGRLYRGKDIVHEGKVVSLRRFKDDVSETTKGQECGIGLENYEAYLPGDIIQVFHVELVKQSL